VTGSDLVAALDLPSGARVNQRVPKKLLAEYGAPTPVDKRRINDGIDEVHWLAALKPTTVGVPAFRDTIREYLEIAVLSVVLRPDASASRLAELVHRAVPYPVFLVTSQRDALTASLAHKRWSQGETGTTVLDGEMAGVDLGAGPDDEIGQAFVAAISIARQPRLNLYALYQGWLDTVLALRAARLTGVFAAAASPHHAVQRQRALAECARLEGRMAGLRASAEKEKQVARRVELNLELQRLRADYAAARSML